MQLFKRFVDDGKRMSDFTTASLDKVALARSVTAGGASVVLKQVYKKYPSDGGDLHALKGVDLTIPSGQIFGIIGRSGAGKSTLVRCINMLEKPTAGEIWVGEHNMTHLNAAQLRTARQRIGMIFQHFNLLSSRTVFDNIALPLELVKTKPSKIHSRVNELIDLVGLGEHMHKHPAQISGGQKQRVGIARALASNPQVLLSDEATSALDPETTSSTLALLQQVNCEMGLTIVMITHQMEVVQRICDRVAVIDEGVVVEEGLVRDVFGFPKTATTKVLVGEATGQALPKETVAMLLKQGEADTRIWRVFGNKPDILTQLVRRFGLDVSLVQALVEDYQGIPLGTLLLQVKGAQAARNEALRWAKTADIEVEEITHA